MNKRYFIVLLTLLFSLVFASCKEDTAPVKEFNVSGIVLPESVDVEAGGTVELKVIGGNGPVEGDQVRLVSSTGKVIYCTIVELKDKSFTFSIPESMSSGRYEFSIVRSQEHKVVGQLQINIIYKQIEIIPDEGTTVYGMVACDGRPLSGVVVSDGYEVVVTDEYGVYQLKSEKKHGYVFVSVPSGYTVMTDGALPLFHKYLAEPASVAERIDFSVVEDPGQDKHTIVVMGDIHLANRTNDVKQFSSFVSDLNAYMAANPGVRFYGLTLGDMSWDQYWVENGYGLSNYLNDISKLNNIAVYNTIGNHDHEQMAAGDFNTVAVYKKIIGPTYYSFNIGKVHYVVLDDIECTNPGSGARTYNTKIVSEQIDWLKKDLSFVDADTPVVLAMHSPVYSDSGTLRLTNADKMVEALGARKVHYMTGHTHVMYNVIKSGQYEHNSGAVCATWWWSAYETPGIHISTDGTPGGYRLFEVNGTDFEWVYKSTGKDLSYQFRSYDRNQICMTAAKYVSSATAANAESFLELAGDYTAQSTANEVLINIWDYDDEWKIKVLENGKELPVTKVTMKDPLHLISYTACRLNKNKTATFPTGNTKHMFKVKASNATSTLDISVTDRFGNVYKETMTRPKSFTVDTYK